MKIRYKLLLIGVGLTVALMTVATYIGYRIFRERTMDDMFRAIDKSLEELEYFFSEEDAIDGLTELKEYVKTIYVRDPDATKDLDSDELLEKCRETYSALYLRQAGMLGLSLPSLEMRQSYFSISRTLETTVVIPGVKSAFICYFDRDNERYVYLVDSEYGLDDTVTETGRYPGAFYAWQPSIDENVTSVNSKYEEYRINGNFFKVGEAAKREADGNGTEKKEYVATVFVQYDTAVAEKAVGNFLKTELIALFIATVVLCLGFILLAHFLFGKNVSALNDSAKRFTENVLNGEDLVVSDPKIKTKDELGVLSQSFMMLEKEIITYTDKIRSDEKEKARLATELNIARQIQAEELPEKGADDEKIKIVSSMTPAKEVGGDFYDYFYLDERKAAVVIADVTGKGVPAALFMMKAKGIVKSALQTESDLETAMFKANNALCENNKAGLFVTLFVGVIDVESGEITCVSAGHEKPYFIGKDGVERMNVSANFVLGGFENFVFKADRTNLNGKRLFLFTDGLNEAINDKKEEFGYDRVVRSLEKTKDGSAESVLDTVKDDLKAFVGEEEPFDDVTLVLFEKKESEKKFRRTFEDPTYEAIEEITDEFSKTFADTDKKVLAKAGIVIDELVNNVVSYEKKEKLTLEVEAQKTMSGELVLRFVSDGEAFDPLKKEKKAQDIRLNENALGGFGIDIIKSLAKEFLYERKDGKNRITVILK